MKCLVDDIDKNRLKRTALEFKACCEKYFDSSTVQEIYRRYSTLVDKAINGAIYKPVSCTPSHEDIEAALNLHIDYQYDVSITVSRFKAALQGLTCIQHTVGLDEFYANEEKYIKKEGDDYYILEEFED